MKKRTPRRPKLTLPERAAKLKPAWFDLNNYSASAKLNEMEWFIQIAFRRRVDIELRYRLQKAEPDNVILREMLELLQTQPIVSFQSISKIGGGEFGARFIQDLAAIHGDPKSLMAMRPMSLFDLIWASKWIDADDLQALEQYWENSFKTIDQTLPVEHQIRLFLAKAIHRSIPQPGKAASRVRLALSRSD